MNVVRWQPFSDMVTLRQAMDRLFDDSIINPSRLTSVFGEGAALPIDMYETDENVVVRANVPGVKPEEMDITITGNTLTINGETKQEQEVKRENYFRQERTYGTFTRNITLPSSLETDKAEAAFENGVLTLTIPKAEEMKPKQIKVKPKGIIEGTKE